MTPNWNVIYELNFVLNLQLFVPLEKHNQKAEEYVYVLFENPPHEIRGDSSGIVVYWISLILANARTQKEKRTHAGTRWYVGV